MGVEWRRWLDWLLVLPLGVAACSSCATAPSPATELLRGSSTEKHPPRLTHDKTSEDSSLTGQESYGALLAYGKAQQLCTARVHGRTIEGEKCFDAGAAVVSLIFREEGSLVARLDDARVVRLSEGALLNVKLPSESIWQQAKPPGDDPVVPGHQAKLLLGDGGGLWLGRCAWVSQLDKPSCVAWTYVRLEGAGARELEVLREAPPAAKPKYGPGKPIAGVAISLNNNAGDALHIDCKRESQSASFAIRKYEGADALLHLQWFHESEPEKVLVIVEHDFLETASEELYVLTPCEASSIKALDVVDGDDDSYQWGPHGTLLYRSSAGWVLRDAIGEIGVLPQSEAAPAISQ